jgi:hypothetical protein
MLADETFKLLRECPTVNEMIGGAKSEWGEERIELPEAQESARPV